MCEPRPPYVCAISEAMMLVLNQDVIEEEEPFPAVDDIEELERDDLVYITVELDKKTGGKTPFALPGVIKIRDDQSKVVKLFRSSIWAEGGEYKAPNSFEIEIKDDTKLRIGGTAPDLGGIPGEGEHEETIGKSYEDLGNVIEVSADVACATNDALSKYLYSDFTAKILNSGPKWALVKGIVLKMANQMGVNKYKSTGPKDQSRPTSVEGKAFKTEFIDPSLAETLSGIADGEERNAVKAGLHVLRAPTLLKHVRSIMDVVVKGPEGSVPVGGKEKKKHEKGGISRADMQKTMTVMEKTMTAMSGQLQDLSKELVVLTQQLRLGGGQPAPPPVALASAESKQCKALSIPPNGNCGFLIMSACQQKVSDPSAKLQLEGATGHKMAVQARRTVALQALEEFNKDKTDFETKHGEYEVYMRGLMANKPEELLRPEAWATAHSFSLFSVANPDIEFRIKQVVEKDGIPEVVTINTRQQHGPQPKKICYARFVNGNHYDLLATTEGEETKYLFSNLEAKQAETIMDTFLLNAPKKPMEFHKDYDAEEFAKVLDGAFGLDLKDNEEESFTLVESKNKKVEKKKQATKAKEAADKKKAEEKSTADLAVAVAKEVAKLNGGAARAPPPPSQWNSNGAGLNGQGQRDQHAGIPPDYKPLAVVFGQGSKKTLRAEIKKAAPEKADLIKSVRLIETGAPRAILYCQEGDWAEALEVITLLKKDNFKCAEYKEHGNRERKTPGTTAVPKAQQADVGLREVSAKAGLCYYSSSGQSCPYGKRGECKFVCASQQSSAQRSQPSGWHR
jgi:hypothetical protein